MIRNVVMGRLRNPGDGADEARLNEALDGIAALALPGQRGMTLGRDAGLRAGGWDFAIVNDWADADAYANYDADPQHNLYRKTIVELCAALSRVQFETP